MSGKTVFISYRRNSVGKLFARSIKEALTHHGYDVFLDVDCLDAGKWEKQILTQVPKRAHFLLLLTPGALDRCTQEDDWVRKEFLKAVASGRNIVPVREESVNLGQLRNSCPESVKSLFDYQIATIQHSGFAPDIETLIERYIPPHKAPSDQVLPPASASVFVADISRIIKYAPAELIGREAEIKVLNDVWDKAVSGEPKRPHVLTFVAMGGEGKTSVVAKWAAELAHLDWPGCDAAFAWSFYSQGTRDQATASSDIFLKEALVFFGDAEMANSAQGSYDKGRRLAQLIGERRALLILDGLEPLQYAPTSPTPGELKDHGLAALLKGLCATSQGLCVVATRHEIPDLRAYWQTTAPQEKLSRLSTEAGVALLRKLGVTGSQKEFENLVEDVQGHALTLNLFGSYLREAYDGDIRKRDLVKLEDADAEEQGGHAFRVMDAYVQWFTTGGKNVEENKKGQRALTMLRLMGLFDRPVTADCFNALLKAPAIPNLTELLIEKKEEPRRIAISRLESAKLLSVTRDRDGTLISLDTHSLLREYFAKQLSEQYPGSWRAAHRRLYKHLIATTNEGDLPTLEDLQPLYQAVAHGCQAGLLQEALGKVYVTRITRREEKYVAMKLGAFGSDLGAVACFFVTPWSRVSSTLAEDDQAWLLTQAAFRLRALGRLTEALEPLRAGLEYYIKQANWKSAAVAVGNLSELELTLGEMAVAAISSERSVSYADRSGDAFHRSSCRTAYADALHQAGRIPEAEDLFREAEQLQLDHQPQYSLLYSLKGFRYCDLLLAAAEHGAWQRMFNADLGLLTSDLIQLCSAVEQRVTQTLLWAEQSNASLLDIAFDHLTLCRAKHYQSILVESSIGNPELDLAVSMFRRAGQAQELPRALLTRAWQRSLTGARIGHESAQSDLDETWEIAERGPMPLYMADIHLHRARLFFREATYPWDSPQTDLVEARRLIEKHGYWRRKEELEDAEAAIKSWSDARS